MSAVRIDSHTRTDTHRADAVGSTPQTTDGPAPIAVSSADLLAADHDICDNPSRPVGGDPSPQTKIRPASTVLASADSLATDQTLLVTPGAVVGGDLLDPDHSRSDIQDMGVGVDSLAADHPILDPQASAVGGDPSTPGHPIAGNQTRIAGGDSQSPGHSSDDHQETVAGWLELRIWSEQLEDAQKARIAAVNRAERGGVDPVVYQPYIEALTAAEHVCELAMRRCYRRVVPAELVAWQKSERGIGEKLTARLLGHLGDPCIATPHRWNGSGTNRVLIADEPFQRSVSQLWQYCGVGDPNRRKRKGMTADEAFALGNPTLKMLLHLHAECCVKAGSGTYRDVYDAARDTYADRLHAADCVRCGPSGKPAPEGSPWSKGHQHAAALRKVAKEILRDLWRTRHAAIRPSTIHRANPIAGSLAGEPPSPPTNVTPTTKARPSAGKPPNPPTTIAPTTIPCPSAGEPPSPPTNRKPTTTARTLAGEPPSPPTIVRATSRDKPSAGNSEETAA